MLIKVNIRSEAHSTISDEEFVNVLRRSSLAERRPVDDPKCIRAMLEHKNLLCTAWDVSTLIGVARSVTDFEYGCYLSDLAVDKKYHRKGIGRELIRLTQSQLGSKANLILIAAPKAEKFCPRVGFEHHKSAWIIPAKKSLK